MREDYMEELDRMFPQGYVIIYTQKNGDIRLSIFNPLDDFTIERFRQLIVQEVNKDGSAS